MHTIGIRLICCAPIFFVTALISLQLMTMLHELGHYLVCKIVNVPVTYIKINIFKFWELEIKKPKTVLRKAPKPFQKSHVKFVATELPVNKCILILVAGGGINFVFSMFMLVVARLFMQNRHLLLTVLALIMSFMFWVNILFNLFPCKKKGNDGWYSMSLIRRYGFVSTRINCDEKFDDDGYGISEIDAHIFGQIGYISILILLAVFLFVLIVMSGFFVLSVSKNAH
jgi:hypothetical protein